jgi:diguanylate cyclase (GGDEF)-like protein
MEGEATRLTRRRLEALPGGRSLGARAEAWLVQIRGPQLGRRFVLDGDEHTLGRDVASDIVVPLDNVSREHARLVCTGGRVVVRDLGSTNGTFVNAEEVVGERELRSGDHLQLGGAIFKFLGGDDIERDYHDTIYRLTIEDGLTQVHNKRYLMEFLAREMGRAHRFGRPLSVMMLDVDHFKLLNDTHGHLVGDTVLRELARRVSRCIRREECFARYGGEEFVVVMPECGPENARRFAEKVRRLVADEPFAHDGLRLPVTLSVGVADLEPQHATPESFLAAADARLYQAKRAGRDRVAG